MTTRTINTHNILYIIFKHKPLILRVFIAVLLLVTLLSFYVTPKYKVFAELLLDMEENKTTVTTLIEKQAILDLTNKINLEQALIKNPVVLEATVAKHLFLDKKLNRDEAAFRRKIKDSLNTFFQFFSGSKKGEKIFKTGIDKKMQFLNEEVDVSQLPNSNILQISLLAGDPVYGLGVLNDLLENYLKYRIKVEKFPGASNFFEEQVNNTKKRLHDMENDLSSFQQKEKIIDYGNEIARISENLKIYDQALANIKIQLIHLKQNYKEQDPQVKNLISEEKALISIIDDIKKRAETLPWKGMFINKLKRDIANETATLTNLIQKRNQEFVSEASDMRLGKIKLVTPPTYLIKREKPKRGLNIFIGAVMGLITGLGLALLREYHDQSYNSEEEISQHLGLPVMGSIQDIGNI